MVLSSGDEPLLERFLLPLTESSMFLRANARAAGLVDRGATFQGSYVATVEDGQRGRLRGVAAHYWNGMLVLQAPVPGDAAALARAAIARSGRELHGLAGPHAQVEAARAALGLSRRPTSLDSREVLFSVRLEELRIPPALAGSRLVCRKPERAELDLVTEWRQAYLVEALGLAGGDALRSRARSEIDRMQSAGDHWLLLDDRQPVSYSAFNARLPDVIQVGGVFTPPPLRGRGYARAVVAGSLLEAREQGASRGILFTGEENRPAIAAYEALGFRAVGDYGLVMFE